MARWLAEPAIYAGLQSPVAISVSGRSADDFGLIIVVWLLPGTQKIGSISFDVHTLLYGAIAIIIGFQAVTFAFFTKLFAISEKLLPEDPELNKIFRHITLETGLMVGAR